MATKSRTKQVVKQLIESPQKTWHKILVYIFYNTKHEERRKGITKHAGEHLRIQFAKVSRC